MGKILIIKNTDFSQVAIEKVNPQHGVTISVNVVPIGSGTVSGAGEYITGETVTLVATASTGYKFSQWNDGTTSSTKTFIAQNNVTYTATFEETDEINVLPHLYAYTQNVYFAQQSAQQVIANHTNKTWAIAAKASDLGLDDSINNVYEIEGTFTADYSGKVTIGTYISDGLTTDEIITVNFSSNEAKYFHGTVTKRNTTTALLFFGNAKGDLEGNVTINSFTVKLVS